jgi:hypothetical protein
MKNFKLVIVSILFMTVISCRDSFHQQDLKLFAGTWKIEKVEIQSTTIENYGEITIQENGEGKMKLNYYPYDNSTPAIEGRFNLVTNSGIDYYVRLYGAYWLNPDGSYGHMMCDEESQLSVRVHNLKKKSMQWEFAETTSVHDCDIRLNASGTMSNVKWYLVRQ